MIGLPSLHRSPNSPNGLSLRQKMIYFAFYTRYAAYLHAVHWSSHSCICISFSRFKVKPEKGYVEIFIVMTYTHSTGIIKNRGRNGIEPKWYVHLMTGAEEISFVPYSINAILTPSQIAASLLYRENQKT